MTRTNKPKSGAVFFRYAKGKSLNVKAAEYQSAFIFSYLSKFPFQEGATPDPKLCITFDVYAPATHEAPGNAIYLYKEIAAVCAGIAERWPAIRPPPNAVL